MEGHKPGHYRGGSMLWFPRILQEKENIIATMLQKIPGKKCQGIERGKHFPVLLFRTPGERKGQKIANHQEKSRRGKVRPWGYQLVLPLDHGEKSK